MARPLRVEFPGATYHAMPRGNVRQRVFRDERDYGRFLDGLEATVDKFGFEIFSFVCLPNHVHLFFRTPEPNLSRGMSVAVTLSSESSAWFTLPSTREPPRKLRCDDPLAVPCTPRDS